MAQPIIPPHGGYQQLRSYRKSVIVFDGTCCFVRRFISARDRTYDQMVQAARSGKQNIVEGSMASAISKETEIKLIGVARASLEELLEDFRDYLRTHQLPLWEKDSPPVSAVRAISRQSDESYESYRFYLENRSAGTCANIMICLIHQCNYLLDLQLKQLTEAFVQTGGLRERMSAARRAERRKRDYTHCTASTR
ncbi:MAG: four helix bundle suffix domain-containing protein [Lentisphaeria bacterium]|nr:four helix bundle suffix domain-containing protein [Lentisphaeria bacterium]